MKVYTINKELAGNRIDKTLPNLDKNLTRVMSQKLIEQGNVKVNGKNVKTSYKLNENDKVEVEIPEVKEVCIEAQDIPVEVLYEDNDIIVVNKPKGLVVHPANGNPDGTLVNALMKICKGTLSGIGGEIRPGIVHRLDKDTSGVLIVAKNDKAHLALCEQIKNREVKKTYLALTRGIIKENEATINMPIGRSTTDRKKMAVVKTGKEAITHFKVLERFKENTLLEINLETGRTHQIRVHLSQIGYPIVGDMVYSNGKNKFGVQGQMLHAWKIKFMHPITGKEMEIEAPLPPYFKDVLQNSKSGAKHRKIYINFLHH